MSSPGLEPREQQVLRFVALFLSEEGYLPSPAEVARGCGMRSATTARRALRTLEDLGLLERDPRYPRLGRVAAPVPAADPVLELWLTEIAILEGRGNLDAIRLALGFAPDLDAVEFLHREAFNRVTLVRAYEDTRRRLHGTGVELTSAQQSSLSVLPSLIEARHSLLDDWATYCLYSAMVTWAVHRVMLRPNEPTLSWLSPIHTAERTAYDHPESRLDRRVVAENMVDRSAQLLARGQELAMHLDLVLAAGDALFPEHFSLWRSRFEAEDFLLGCTGALAPGAPPEPVARPELITPAPPARWEAGGPPPALGDETRR